MYEENTEIQTLKAKIEEECNKLGYQVQQASLANSNQKNQTFQQSLQEIKQKIELILDNINGLYDTYKEKTDKLNTELAKCKNSLKNEESNLSEFKTYLSSHSLPEYEEKIATMLNINADDLKNRWKEAYNIKNKQKENEKTFFGQIQNKVSEAITSNEEFIKKVINDLLDKYYTKFEAIKEEIKKLEDSHSKAQSDLKEIKEIQTQAKDLINLATETSEKLNNAILKQENQGTNNKSDPDIDIDATGQNSVGNNQNNVIANQKEAKKCLEDFLTAVKDFINFVKNKLSEAKTALLDQLSTQNRNSVSRR